MVSRRCKLAVLYVFLGSALLVLQPATGQTQQHPTPQDLQTLLLIQNLMKANPSIARLVNLAASTPSNVSATLLQGVTMNPLLSSLLAGFQNLQNPLKPLLNQSATSNNTNQTTTSAQTNPLAVFQQIIKNPLMNKVITAAFDEVISGLADAKANNVTLDSNLTSLISLIHPLSILRKVVVPGFAASQLPNQPDLVNPTCHQDIIDSLDALAAGKGWAIELFDAQGKPTSGVERGSFYFVGSYDQCQRIKGRVEQKTLLLKRAREFDTRHCRVDIAIPKSLTDSLNVDTRGVHLKLIWGMCVPASCHGQDVRGLFQLGVIKRANLQIEDVTCQEELDLGSDKSAIAAVTVLSFFGLLVLTGTLYEGCRELNKRTEKPQTKPNHESAERQNNGLFQPPGVTGTDNEKKTSNNNVTGTTVPNNVYVNGGPPEVSANETNTSLNQGGPDKEYANIELPHGYIPHREGPVIPIPTVASSKPASNGAINTLAATTTAPQGSAFRKPRDPLVVRMLRCFSLYTNVPKVLQAKSAAGSITCVHGIRFFSLMWVVLGHTYNYGIISNEGTFTADNLLDFESILQRFSFQAVMAGGYAVDTFFVLSAFLLTWIQLKQADKSQKACTLNTGLMYYFHRFWRLTPIYMIVLMTYTCLYRYLGSGPFWPSSIRTADTCRTSWWTNLLYVNNLVKTDEQCMGWSWYLANDMQFYVISPLFIMAMFLSPIRGAVFTSLLMCLGIGIAFWKEHVYNGNFLTMLSDGGDYWKQVYTVPWCRVSCWAVGMLLGLVVHKRGNRPLRNTKLYFLGWLLATGAALFLAYITHSYNKKGGATWTRAENALYESFGRAIWGMCIAWVIFACHTGKGGLVNSILSWNGLIPLSRLTYAAYLVHPICMEVYVFSRRNMLHVTDYNIIYLYMGHACVAFMVAFVFSLAFEAPFMGLEKIIFHTKRQR